VAPAAILAANNGAGITGPPIITAGGVAAGPLGGGHAANWASVIARAGVVGVWGSAPSSPTAVSSLSVVSSAITLTTTALGCTPAAGQSPAPHRHTR